MNFVQQPAPAKLNESIAAYEHNAGELEKRLIKLEDATWGKKVRFLVNGNVSYGPSADDPGM